MSLGLPVVITSMPIIQLSCGAGLRCPQHVFSIRVPTFASYHLVVWLPCELLALSPLFSTGTGLYLVLSAA